MSVCLVYITAGTVEEATRIGEALVDERLAACVNVLAPITSIYRWQGSVQRDGEVALIAKTRDSLVERLTTRVVELHSYECPCVVALPVAGGHRAFLDWIDAQTAVD